jgi:hypothetical protein
MPDCMGCKRDLRSSGMLRGVDWYLFSDVSGEATGHNFNGEGCPLKVSPKGCPETSVNKYQSTVRNIPEERSSLTTLHNYPHLVLTSIMRAEILLL